jgi:hypothetical protein
LAAILGADEKRKSARCEFGKGRAAYLQRLVPAIPVPAKTAMAVKYWAPPRNAAEFLQALRWAGGEKLNWEIQSPPFVAAEAYRQPEQNRYILHLVNYNCWKQPEVRDIPVTYRADDAGSRLTVYSPDGPAITTLQAERVAGGFRFVLPKLGIYSVVVIQK